MRKSKENLNSRGLSCNSEYWHTFILCCFYPPHGSEAIIESMFRWTGLGEIERLSCRHKCSGFIVKEAGDADGLVLLVDNSETAEIGFWTAENA